MAEVPRTESFKQAEPVDMTLEAAQAPPSPAPSTPQARRFSIKQGVLALALLAGAAAATGLAAFETAQRHRPIAAHTQASDSFAPATNTDRGGAMVVYQPVW